MKQVCRGFGTYSAVCARSWGSVSLMTHMRLEPCPADEAVLASELKLIGSCRDERDQRRIDGLRALCQQLGVQVGMCQLGPWPATESSPALEPGCARNLSRYHELWSMTASSARPS